MHPSMVSAFPAKRLIIKIVRAVVPQESGDKGKLENRKPVGRREAEQRYERLQEGAEAEEKLEERYSP